MISSSGRWLFSPGWAQGPVSRSISTASIASGRCRTSASPDCTSWRAAGLVRTAVRDRVQDAQGAVVPEHHRHRQVRATVSDPRGQAGLAEPSLAVQQHPGSLTGAQRAQRSLQFPAAADEHFRRRYWHVLLAAQERLGAMRGCRQGPFAGAAHDRAAPAGTEPQPGQVPIRPHHRIA